MKKHTVFRYLLLLLMFTVSAASQMLCLKADIGVIPVWDAITANLSEITGIRIGYFATALNLAVFVIWLILLRKDFRPIRLLSLAVALFLGPLQNFFYYNVYTFEISSYAMRVVLLVAGNLLLAASVGIITYIDLISFPLEGLCYTLERRYGISVKITRTLPDVICIVLSVLLSVLFHTTLKIREGTVISMLLMGPVMGTVMDFIRKHHWLE